MKDINSLLDIADTTDAFFIDVFGVLWDGFVFYPKALNICQQLIKRKKRIYVLSNTTMLGSHFKEKHISHGFIQGVHYTDVITSGDVLKYALERQYFLDTLLNSKTAKFLLIGRPNDSVLASVLHRQTQDITQAKAVYIGSLQLYQNNTWVSQLDIQPFIPFAQKALDHNIPCICANPDYFAFVNNQKIVTQGNLAQWYEDHGGRVYWFGKPHKNLYDYAIKIAQVFVERSIMVGDTIRTDILGGVNSGMKTVLILGYGITQDKLDQGISLQQIIQQEGAAPDFILNQLK